MKKKIVSALLCATMAASLLAGCGSSEGGTADTSKGGDSGTKTEVSDGEGKVLNIYCWNEEFKTRLTDHYPDYKEVDATHGKICTGQAFL